MVLFNKTFEELREAFVQGWFAERQHFGNPKIEDWLAGQRGAEKPDEQWRLLFLCQSLLSQIGFEEGYLIATLLQYAEPATAPFTEIEQDTKSFLCFLLSLLRHLDPADTKIYYNGISFCTVIVVCGREKAYVFRREGDQDVFCEVIPINSVAVLRAIYITWMDNGLRAIIARQFLCEKLGLAIAQVRAEAEADFDRAVAVSEDGKEIVKVHRVLVYDGDKRLIVFPAESFRKDKIRRDTSLANRRRFSVRTIDETASVSDFLADMAIMGPDWPYCELQMFVADKEKGIPYFISHAKFCPQPLPEGGKELK